jgi:hypothetical protein
MNMTQVGTQCMRARRESNDAHVHYFVTNTTPVSQTQTHFKSPMCCVCACNSSDSYSNSGNQGHFCDITRWNAVPDALSQKDANRNGVLEPFFLVSVWLTPPSPTKFCFVSLYVPETFFGLLSKNKSRLIYQITSLSACARECVSH